MSCLEVTRDASSVGPACSCGRTAAGHTAHGPIISNTEGTAGDKRHQLTATTLMSLALNSLGICSVPRGVRCTCTFWSHSEFTPSTLIFGLYFPWLKKNKNCIKEQTLTGSNKKLPSPECNTRLGAKKQEGKKKKVKPSSTAFSMLKILTAKGQQLLKSVFCEKFNSESLLKWGRFSHFITSFSLQRTISAKHLKRHYVRFSYIVSYAAMHERGSCSLRRLIFPL